MQKDDLNSVCIIKKNSLSSSFNLTPNSNVCNAISSKEIHLNGDDSGYILVILVVIIAIILGIVLHP